MMFIACLLHWIAHHLPEFRLQVHANLGYGMSTYLWIFKLVRFFPHIRTSHTLSTWAVRNGNIYYLLSSTYLPIYRVSHLKLYKVIWLCWGYRFWFLLIFLVLCVHEIGPFMPNSSVFIFLMLRTLYRLICKNSEKKIQKRVWMYQM